MSTDVERRFQQLAWPEPGAGLRTRVLASPVRTPACSWADRVWFSRAWRFGAAAAVAGLVAAEAWSMAEGAGAVGRGVQVTSSSALALADLGLPAGAVDALSSRRPDLDAWPALRSLDLTGEPR